MKILLVRPSNRKLYDIPHPRRDEPLNLEYLAAPLISDHDVKILDLDVVENVAAGVEAEINDFAPDILGISVASAMLVDAKRIIATTKQVRPECKTIIGGIHPTALPEESIDYTGADFVTMGEGEFTLKELADGRDHHDIRGIIYKESGRFVKNEKRDPVQDLGEIPQPAHHFVRRSDYRMNEFFEDYFTEAERPIYSGMVITSRGCPYKCIYCSSKCVLGDRVRFRTSDHVVDELEFLAKDLGVKAVIFADDCFTLKKKRTLEICNEIIRRKIDMKWWVDTRVDHISEELLHAMKEAGCRFIVYGVESGSDRVLKVIKRGMKVAKIREVFALTHKVGIDAKANFTLGHLSETEEEIFESIRLAQDLGAAKSAFYLVLPLPGTPLYTLARRDDLITGDFSEFRWYGQPVAKVSKVAPERLKELQKLAYEMVPDAELMNLPPSG